MSVEHLSAAELEELSLYLSAIEDWLRDACTARHNDDMADGVHRAWVIIDDLHDEAYEREHRPLAVSATEPGGGPAPGAAPAQPSGPSGVRQRT